MFSINRLSNACFSLSRSNRLCRLNFIKRDVLLFLVVPLRSDGDRLFDGDFDLILLFEGCGDDVSIPVSCVLGEVFGEWMSSLVDFSVS